MYDACMTLASEVGISDANVKSLWLWWCNIYCNDNVLTRLIKWRRMGLGTGLWMRDRMGLGTGLWMRDRMGYTEHKSCTNFCFIAPPRKSVSEKAQ